MITIIGVAPVTRAVSGRSLVSEDVFEVLTARIVADRPDIDLALAARIMDQALVFLAAAGQRAGGPLAPSALVDVGWHTFLLYTRLYQEFCERVAGRFIHHVPDDDPTGPAASASGAAARSRTLAAITAAGYAVDPELWTPVAGDCGNCEEDGNCSASGKEGTENTETRRR